VQKLKKEKKEKEKKLKTQTKYDQYILLLIKEIYFSVNANASFILK